MQLKIDFDAKQQGSAKEIALVLFFIFLVLICAFLEKVKPHTPPEKEVQPRAVSREKRIHMTLTELREIPGYENISDEEGNFIIETSANISRLICEIYKRQNP